MMSSFSFEKTTADIAAWNLATFNHLSDERIKQQAKGLKVLDAELVAFVEIKNEVHIQSLVAHLKGDGVEYEYDFIPQAETTSGHKAMHIGVMYKKGISVTNSHLLDGSDLGNDNMRKAYVCDVTIGKFDFKLIAVHLKSGRELKNQKIRDEQCKVIGQFIKGISD